MQKAQPDTVALFISDLHLSPACPNTTQTFLTFLRTRALQTQQLYILGDLFEVWIGDDGLNDPWNRSIAAAIRAVADAGVKVFWIGGNRDFLLGPRFAEAAGMTLLPERHVIDIAGRRVALVHGDAQCTNDASYLRFRARTHHPLVKKLFLALPLSWRQSIVSGIRDRSRQSKVHKTMAMMDVSEAAIDALFATTGASVLIHGHTHMAGRHDSPDGTRIRYVLPDWDGDCKPERGGWIGIFPDGTIRRFDLTGRMVTSYIPGQ